ncbi:ABC-three component system middle component 5 [Tritonibacter mobilis]|uniref:ABC-three component system middle component 5 n=1 Tax=Tritonibacter mobilis TaxID=379347 RepID=UPI000F7DE076|nr:ABC-three component system middle component 5 [Tritonibacter mobilis]
MFSLTYTSAYDPYHTTFRFLTLLDPKVGLDAVCFEALRIVDFYHNFPWLLKDFSAYSKISGFQKDKNWVVRNYPKSKFEVLPDKYQVFQRMLPPHLSALAALTQLGMIEVTEDVVYTNEAKLNSTSLQKKVEEYREQHHDFISFLVGKVAKVPLFGPGGLKERSGLGEFRYDVV